MQPWYIFYKIIIAKMKLIQKQP